MTVKGKKSKKPVEERNESGLSVVCIADIKPRPINWLWKPYIPLGHLTLMEGDPGVGKSWCSLAIAADISRGQGPWGKSEPADVLLCSAGKSFEGFFLKGLVKPRLEARGADCYRIFAVKEPLTLDESGVLLLEAWMKEYAPALIIVDPLYDDEVDDFRWTPKVYEFVWRLKNLAAIYECAILVVREFTDQDDFYFPSVLLVEADPDDPFERRAFIHRKCNLAPCGPSREFQIIAEKFFWTDEPE